MGAVKEFNLQVRERMADLNIGVNEAVRSVRRDWRRRRLDDLRSMIFNPDRESTQDAQEKVREALLEIISIMREDER